MSGHVSSYFEVSVLQMLHCFAAMTLSRNPARLKQIVNYTTWIISGPSGTEDLYKVSLFCYLSKLLQAPLLAVCCNVVIWLILPVVICLSQRLSHACVSISIIRRNCEWLIKSVIVYLIIESYMDNRDKLQLIHAIRPGPRVVIIRY